MSIGLTNKQARQFMLIKHGLTGAYKFSGKQGVLDFVRQAGCLQFDPIDVCGKNAELVLQSRVKGFKKQMLYELLYEDRKLIDYFDKNLAIMDISDWKYFARTRAANQNGGRSHGEVEAVREEIRAAITQRGALSSADVGLKDKVSWYWSDTNLSRAALETLYFRGELVVHHKKGTIKYYDLAESCVPADILNAPDPYPDDFEHMKWRVARRIGGVGLLWNKPSDAWLNIWNMKSAERANVFASLLAEGKIMEISVEGIKDALYCAAGDADILNSVLSGAAPAPRCELIAPLDNMLWDRKLIKALFGFEYKWEIYTPARERKYGYYTLPLLYGNGFIGRAEIICDRKARRMKVLNIWYEGTPRAAVSACIRRFAAFNGCEDIIFEEGGLGGE